jgi:hypothetical protein
VSNEKEDLVRRRSRGAALWTFRDGKIAGTRLFQSRDEALEAVDMTADAGRDPH